MTNFISVSFADNEDELYKWVKGNKKIKTSEICKKALAKKREEILMLEQLNPLKMKKSILKLQETIELFTDFIDKQKLSDEWIDFFTNNDQTKKKSSSPYIKEIKLENEKIE